MQKNLALSLLLTNNRVEGNKPMEIDKKRQHYEALFTRYPDVVDTETVREMLGGIGICTVLKLIRKGHLKHFHYLEQKFLIPKEWLIDYIMSDYYANFKHSLKAQI